MKNIFLLMIGLLCSMPAIADCLPDTCMMDRLSIGIGPVRENDGAAYKAVRFDARMTEHFEANLGMIMGGDHPSTATSASRALDYRTTWIGGSFLEIERYLFGSVGMVRLTRQTKHLTSPYQFLITFGVHFDEVSLSYVHLSNGHTGGKNYGEDMMILAYGF